MGLEMKLTVVVHPNSRSEKVELDLLKTTHVYVKEPPIEDKANKAAIKALTKSFKASKSKVSLVSGAKSKIKVFEIS